MLIRSYLKEGDICLDNTMGSGTLNLVCLEEGIQSIGIEKEKDSFDIAVKRLQHYSNNSISYCNKLYSNPPDVFK